MIFRARGAFTVSIADAAHVVEADYFGVESGNRVADKFEKSGPTASKSEIMDAPVINEFPLCLECEFIEYIRKEQHTHIPVAALLLFILLIRSPGFPKQLIQCQRT